MCLPSNFWVDRPCCCHAREAAAPCHCPEQSDWAERQAAKLRRQVVWVWLPAQQGCLRVLAGAPSRPSLSSPRGWNLDLDQGESRSLGVSSGTALLAGGEGAHEYGPHKGPHGLRFCPPGLFHRTQTIWPLLNQQIWTVSPHLISFNGLLSNLSLGLGLHTTSSRQEDSLLQTLLLEPLLLSLSTNGVTGNDYFQLSPSPSLHSRQL